MEHEETRLGAGPPCSAQDQRLVHVLGDAQCQALSEQTHLRPSQLVLSHGDREHPATRI